MPYAEHLRTEPNYSQNPWILKWWTDAHDELLLDAIEKDHWIWYLQITEKIREITPEEILEEWWTNDPICSKYAWYNVLRFFASARATDLGYDRKIRQPISKKCAACDRVFKEDSIPESVIRYLRVDQIDVCLQCINSYFGYGGDPDRRYSEAQILDWIVKLCDELNVIPPQSILGSLTTLTSMSTEERVKLLGLVEGKPTLVDVKRKFGSWLNALVEAGVLEGGVRETSRGTQCLAKDGHVCFSYGEKTLDDFLFTNQIAHDKEPPYPDSKYRSDFKIGEYFVEYFGMAGDDDYDKRSQEKHQIAEKAGIRLISLYPDDLLSERAIKKKLESAIDSLTN